MEKLHSSVRSLVGSDTCIKIYNIEDQKIIGVFPNYDKASVFLGLSRMEVSVILRRKTKHFCKKLKTVIAVRFGNRKDLNKEDIIQRIQEFPKDY